MHYCARAIVLPFFSSVTSNPADCRLVCRLDFVLVFVVEVIVPTSVFGFAWTSSREPADLRRPLRPPRAEARSFILPAQADPREDDGNQRNIEAMVDGGTFLQQLPGTDCIAHSGIPEW